jgi:hypothetical protein
MYDVQEKWQDGEYRAKVARSSRSAEVRSIHTLAMLPCLHTILLPPH